MPKQDTCQSTSETKNKQTQTRAVVVAQLVQRSLLKSEIRSSNPILFTINCFMKCIEKKKEPGNGSFLKKNADMDENGRSS